MTNKSEKLTELLENVKTPEEFLNAIDFNVLRDIFDKLAQKSGSPASMLQIENSVKIDTESETIGENTRIAGEVVKGEAVLYWKALSTAELPLPVFALQTLIHELVHLHARRVSISDATLLPDFAPAHANDGLLEVVRRSDEDKILVLARGLNEAVTEEISGGILIEYLRRIGERALINTLIDKEQSDAVYILERIILNATVNSLANKVGLDRDTVWNSFVQVYLHGEHATLNLLLEVAKELGNDEDGDKILQLLELIVEPEEASDYGREAKKDKIFDEIEKNKDLLSNSIQRVVYRFRLQLIHDALGLK